MLESELDPEVREVLEERSRTLREWMVYRGEVNKSIHDKFSEMLACQERALSELKIASPSLYDQAVQVRLL